MINKIKKIKYLPKIIINKFNSIILVAYVKNLYNDYSQIRFYRKHIGNNKLVYDVGANTGSKVDLFLKLNSKVIAIEPQSDYAGYLRVKYRSQKSVVVEQLGLGAKDGEIEINISEKYPGFSSFIKTWQVGTKYHTFTKTEKVHVTTIDELINKWGLPDFCKIDVEGYEFEVLSGLNKKIALLNFEFHSDDMVHIKKCLARLKSIGYTEFNFIESENSKMTQRKWLNNDEILKEITKKNQKLSRVIWGDIYAK